MTITVLNTYAAMTGILRAPAADRTGMLRSMLEPVRDMYRFVPGDVDLVAMHRMASGFPLDRDEGRCLDALETLAAARAWNRMQEALDAALAVQLDATPELAAPDITVLVVLGDPGDAHFMDTSLGVTGSGGISGYIVITLWPFPENVERLAATAVHELNHNLRYSPGGMVWNPATVTVGEHVVSEGLADAFARQMYGDDLGYPHRRAAPARRRGVRQGADRARRDRHAEFHRLGTRRRQRRTLRRHPGRPAHRRRVRGRQPAGRRVPGGDRSDTGAGPARQQRGDHRDGAAELTRQESRSAGRPAVPSVAIVDLDPTSGWII